MPTQLVLSPPVHHSRGGQPPLYHHQHPAAAAAAAAAGFFGYGIPVQRGPPTALSHNHFSPPNFYANLLVKYQHSISLQQQQQQQQQQRFPGRIGDGVGMRRAMDVEEAVAVANMTTARMGGCGGVPTPAATSIGFSPSSPLNSSPPPGTFQRLLALMSSEAAARQAAADAVSMNTATVIVGGGRTSTTSPFFRIDNNNETGSPTTSIVVDKSLTGSVGGDDGSSVVVGPDVDAREIVGAAENRRTTISPTEIVVAGGESTTDGMKPAAFRYRNNNNADPGNSTAMEGAGIDDCCVGVGTNVYRRPMSSPVDCRRTTSIAALRLRAQQYEMNLHHLARQQLLYTFIH